MFSPQIILSVVGCFLIGWAAGVTSDNDMFIATSVFAGFGFIVWAILLVLEAILRAQSAILSIMLDDEDLTEPENENV